MRAVCSVRLRRRLHPPTAPPVRVAPTVDAVLASSFGVRHGTRRGDSHAPCGPPRGLHPPRPSRAAEACGRDRGAKIGRAGLAGARGGGRQKSGAPGWGAGRCKISGALRFKTDTALVGPETPENAGSICGLHHCTSSSCEKGHPGELQMTCRPSQQLRFGPSRGLPVEVVGSVGSGPESIVTSYRNDATASQSKI